MIDFLDIVLLGFLVLIALAVTRLRNLLAAVVLSGMYSLLSASVFIVLDAVDVAFTEAAVGAGISTVLMIGTLVLTGTEEKKTRPSVLPLAVVLITGILLVYGTLDMPHFGDPGAPVHTHVAPRYIEESPREIGVPNMVTSVLASYRGYDTLGETTVVFTATIGVLVLLGAGRRWKQEETP